MEIKFKLLRKKTTADSASVLSLTFTAYPHTFTSPWILPGVTGVPAAHSGRSSAIQATLTTPQ